MEENITRLAEAYAKATTTARCARMGKCDGCQVRTCDYRSRLEAYLQGYAEKQRQIEWDIEAANMLETERRMI